MQGEIGGREEEPISGNTKACVCTTVIHTSFNNTEESTEESYFSEGNPLSKRNGGLDVFFYNWEASDTWSKNTRIGSGTGGPAIGD